VNYSTEELPRVTYDCFAQDNALENFTENSMLTLQAVFDERIINRGLWPTHSKYFNGVKFQTKVYRNNPCFMDQISEY
jgi:hypothetical protein